MFVLPAFFMFCFIGTLGARQPYIDINRVQLLPKDTFDVNNNHHSRRSIEAYKLRRANGYDNNNSGNIWPRVPLLHRATEAFDATKKAPLKVHQPREDPRFFYQSNIYLKENDGENGNNEVSMIYPRRDVVRAGDDTGRRSLPFRLKDRELNLINEGFGYCVRCPHDRTIIAKAASDRVMLQYPRLFTCSGLKAPTNVRFVHLYGPKFGSLLEGGSHVVVGRMVFKGKNLQLCKMQVHVVVQGCLTPKYLVSHCEDLHKPCNFTCRDTKLELHGPSSLVCGENMNWSEDLPICRVRTWCEPPPPPEHGQISCKGATAGSWPGPGLVEGSRCRVRCTHGWRWSPRGVAVCRRGAWTQALACQPIRS